MTDDAPAAPHQQPTPPPPQPAGQAQPAVQPAAPRGRWTFRAKITILLACVLAAVCLWLIFRNVRKERQMAEKYGAELDTSFPGDMNALAARRSRLLGGIDAFGADGTAMTRGARGESRPMGTAPPESDESLFQLAQKLKDSGFKLMGVSYCRPTQAQREMFGGRGSRGRKVLESIYTECRTAEACPGVRAYPTWVRGNEMFAGKRGPVQLRAMLKNTKHIPPRTMLQGAPEPLEENLPDAQHEANVPRQRTPDDMSAYGVSAKEIARQVRLNDANNVAAALEAGKLDPYNEEGGEDADDEGGESGGAENAKGGRKREFARGVSNFPPLNAPFMPGTEPFQLDISRADHQTMQGNVPRAAVGDRVPSASILNQVVSAFEHAANDATQRSEGSSSYSETRLPHSRQITTGEGMDTFTNPDRLPPGATPPAVPQQQQQPGRNPPPRPRGPAQGAEAPDVNATPFSAQDQAQP
jgi:hypothetical protein